LIAISGGFYFAALRWFPRFAPVRQRFAGMIAYARNLMSVRFLQYAQGAGVDLVIGVLVSPAAVALLRMGGRLVQLLSEIVQNPVETLGWIRFAEARRQSPQALRAEGTSFTMSLTLIGAGMFVGMACIMPLLIPLALGPGWEGAVIVGVVLSLAKAVNMIIAAALPLIGNTDGSKWLARQQLFAAGLALILATIAAPFGLLAVTLAVATPQILTTPILLWVMSRMGVIDLGAVLRASAVAAACAALMAGAVLFVDAQLGDSGLPAFVLFVLQIAVGTAVFVPAALTFAPKASAPLAQAARGLFEALARKSPAPFRPKPR
jgi:O-antigen/teichoic acid export membrane protein